MSIIMAPFSEQKTTFRSLTCGFFPNTQSHALNNQYSSWGQTPSVWPIWEWQQSSIRPVKISWTHP